MLRGATDPSPAASALSSFISRYVAQIAKVLAPQGTDGEPEEDLEDCRRHRHQHRGTSDRALLSAGRLT